MRSVILLGGFREDAVSFLKPFTGEAKATKLMSDLESYLLDLAVNKALPRGVSVAKPYLIGAGAFIGATFVMSATALVLSIRAARR